MKSLVSIITPVFNSERFIRRAYESVLTQTHRDWEWLVVDDASTDSSYEVLSALEDPRVVVLRLPENLGAAAARNLALEKARGDVLAFLDVDDTWEPEKLALGLEAMAPRGRDFIYTNYRKRRGSELGPSVIETPQEVTFTELLRTCHLCTSTVMIRRSITEGLRMEVGLRRGQDYLFWLGVIQRTRVAYRASTKALTHYSVGHASLSSNKLRKASLQWRIYRRYLGLNFTTSLGYFSSYAFHGLRKFIKF